MNKLATAFICVGIFVVMGAVGNDDFHHIELVKAGQYVAEEAPSLLQTFLLSVAGLMSMGFGVFLLSKNGDI